MLLCSLRKPDDFVEDELIVGDGATVKKGLALAMPKQLEGPNTARGALDRPSRLDNMVCTM